MPFGLPLSLRLGGRPLSALPDLAWARSFWLSLSPYAYARAEDCAVILPPNLVYKTNATGVALLDFVGKGGRFEDIPGFDAAKAGQIEDFFLTLKAVYDGRPGAPRPAEAPPGASPGDGATGPLRGPERVAYDFDFTRLPVLGEIAVTYRCNNRCRFCYAGCGGEAKATSAEGELELAGLMRVIDIFKHEAKIPFFSFTGGEPLIRPEIEELAAYAVSLGLRVNLVSNGSLATPERALSLYAAGVKSAQISLEAPEAALHDELCGRVGAFEETLAGIEALRSAGVSVQTNSTMTARNAEALMQLPAFARKLGISRLSMNLFIPVGSGASEGALVLPYEQAGAYVDRARKAALAAGVDFFWYSPTPLCLYNPIARGLGNKSCAACDGLLSVAPDGGLLPCSSWPEPVGSLVEREFSELWFSAAAQRLKHKEYAPDGCKACASFTACQAACPLYWEARGYGEIERFWKERR